MKQASIELQWKTPQATYFHKKTNLNTPIQLIKPAQSQNLSLSAKNNLILP
jgi:hypothetical protein